MRKILSPLILFVFWAIGAATAQQPQQLNYQAIARNSNGQPLVGGAHITMRFTIHNNSATGNIVFTETQTGITNTFGLVSTKIGAISNLNVANWSNGAKYLQVEMDPNGGSNFMDMGTSQLVSVPYALFAGNSEPGTIGATGFRGVQGITGPMGPVGPTGLPGTNGSNGNRGATGAAGATGVTGNNGVTGATGIAGLTGTTGVGAPGVTGATGGFAINIGDLYGGGIVVDVWDSAGVQHGLIASLTDISNNSIWGNVIHEVGPTAESFSNGKANTYAAVAQPGDTTGAALLCRAYNAGGYTDWYLPAITELKQCYKSAAAVNRNLGDINGFQPTEYWSSTEYRNDQDPLAYWAWYFHFSLGWPYADVKDIDLNVRAVRRF